MKLPNMKYGSGDIRKTLSVFGGLNRKIGAGDGELIDGENLGASAFPALSPRAGRGVYNSYTSPTDIFEWDGHVVIVDGFDLLLDGKVIGNVSAGKKQFAVVNTQLVVWPDKVYYDFEDGTYHRMDASVTSDSADPSAYTSNTLTLGESGVLAQGAERITKIDYNTNTSSNDFYIYAKSYTSLTWTEGAWVGEGEAETEIASGWTGKFIKLRKNDVAGVYNLNYRSDEVVWQYGQGTTTQPIKEYGEDMDEVCAEIVSVNVYTESPAPEAVYVYTVNFRIIEADYVETPLDQVFEAGDWVTLNGVPSTAPSKQYKVTAVDGETRTLTFEGEPFKVLGDYYYRLESDMEAFRLRSFITLTAGRYENGQVYPPTYYARGYIVPALPKGSVLFSSFAIPHDNSDPYSLPLTVWNGRTGTVSTLEPTELAKGVYYEGMNFPAAAGIELTFTQGTGIMDWAVAAQKGAPGMDYICAHNNRLYGVSNSANVLNEDGTVNENYTTRIIYVSELGVPHHFNTFTGTDADSYQVAEASNGDFTGCISYGDHVLFFKEHKVIKFYGDYPSAMGFTYDDIEGVKEGCEKSMVIANEVLYYMGRAGFCAYTGSVPSIISYKLDREYDRVVCGTDGKKVMLCGTDGEKHELLSYNIAEGIWLREDESDIKAMALVGGKLHMIRGRQVLIDGGEEKVRWWAEFHPFTEETFERKRWKYIRVRAELEAGALIKVTAKIGDGEYETQLTAQNSGWQTITVPLPLNRTDRMSLRIEGEGKAIVREIERQYQRGSDR